jgi:AraC-like DNA-binding protein
VETFRYLGNVNWANVPHIASCRFSDAEQVRSFYADEYSTCAALGRPEPHGRVDVSAHQLRMGPLEVTEHRRSLEMAFRVERDDAYIVCLNAVGALAVEQAGESIAGSPTRALVYRPSAGRAVFRSGPANRARGLLIQRWALASRLELLLGHPVPSTIAIAPTIELHTAGGRAWLDLLGLVAAAFHDPDHIVLRPITTEPLCHALIDGLLMISDHPYSATLHQPAATCRPRHVKIALDAIHDRPDHPHTTESLAQLAGVGVRNLQTGFQRHLNMTPMAYLRQIRLARVHDDLRERRVATITEAAHRWGFTHLGRFAADYRAKYGEVPSSWRATT